MNPNIATFGYPYRNNINCYTIFDMNPAPTGNFHVIGFNCTCNHTPSPDLIYFHLVTVRYIGLSVEIYSPTLQAKSEVYGADVGLKAVHQRNVIRH